MKGLVYWIGLKIYLYLFAFISLQAVEGVELFIGPEIYHVSRTKEGGAKQKGELYGVRLGYEKVKRYKFYYALEGLYSKGILEGKNHENPIRSELTNSNIETRWGYTLQSKAFPYFSFTPFFGIGYIWELNHYLHPSPFKVQFDNQFPYIPFGCLASLYIAENVQIGLKFIGRFLWDGKQKVKDSELGSLTQCYEEQFQYRIELPLSYLFCWKNRELAIRAVPFYEYRRYGTSINFPFDFIDTKFEFYGANMELIYYF